MNLRNKYLLFSFILSLSVARGFAQDVHFSQYYFSPLTLNPANTGNYRGDYRLFGNYRSQWKELNNAYNTFSAGGDFNIFPRNINASGGLLFLSDRSAENLLVTKILPSAAAHIRLAGYKLHAGIQPGLVIKSIDFYKNSFPEQLNWETGVFDHTLPNSETNVSQRYMFLDLGAGLGASRRFGVLEPELGVAFFHINRPKESFFGDNNRLRVRKAINATLKYYHGNNLVLHLHSLYGFTTRVSDWVSGLTAEYVLSRTAMFSNSVFAGVMFRDGIRRNADAAIVTAGLHYSHYTIGFSYDITYSQLKTAVDNKGAFEIAIIYRANSTRLNKKIMPCERY